MRIYKGIALLLLAFLTLCVSQANGQTRTVGKIYYDDTLASPGYTLFTPNQSFKTFLIENCGLKVHEWTSAFQPGMMAYLREDGNLLRADRDYSNVSFPSNGGNGGYVELLDWWSQRLWLYKISDSLQQAHHDIYPMPNGNVLIITWEKMDQATAIAEGRDPAQIVDQEIWMEAIYEIKPVYPDAGNVVWKWNIKDHLVQDFDNSKANYGNVTDHPELLDINYLGISLGRADWLHANSVAYNASRDEVIIGFRETSEVIVIDHSTTMAEASGHTGGNRGKGGDILFRWGNPEAYRRGNGADKKLFEQHDAHWVEESIPSLAGEIMIFNNGFTRAGGYSSVEFIVPEVDSNGSYVIHGGPFLPDTAKKTFRTLPGDTIDSGVMGGAQLLSNGNLLVSQAVHGRFVEFDSTGQKVWEYINPAIPLSIYIAQGQTIPTSGFIWSNAVFKARKYLVTYPGLAAQPLPHLAPLESNPWPDSTCATSVGFASAIEREFQVFPNPAHDILHIQSNVPQMAEWALYDSWGRVMRSGVLRGLEVAVETAELSSGIYVLRIGKDFHRKIVVSR